MRLGYEKVRHATWQAEDDPERDHVGKREEYARAGVLEYWIVDPTAEQVWILALPDGKYVEHAVGGRGDFVFSMRFPGLVISVAAVFDAGRPA